MHKKIHGSKPPSPVTAPTEVSFESIEKRLNEAGFPLVGVVDYEAALPWYAEHATRYQRWIENGSHGSMEYLKRGLERRLNPKLVFPQLESVIVVARPYTPHAIEKNGIRYARYLNDRDYHEVLKENLQEVFQELPFSSKICVDTSAVLERTWGALTGLGWIGKNTLLIHPQHGSFNFLSVIFTSAKFDRAPTLLKDYCGSCTRCLDACPTKAFPEPHYLESRRCISYLTLEKRGEWDAPVSTQGYVAGCDLCQEVCPYNTKPKKNSKVEVHAEHLVTDLATLFEETESQYLDRVKGTALSRVKFADFKRNLSAALPTEFKFQSASHKK